MANGKGLLVGAGLGLVAIFGGANAWFQYGTVEQERVTVIGAEEVFLGAEAGKQKRLQVVLENGCTETYKVEDSLWHWNFRSANLHAIFDEAVNSEGREDNVFDITHYGWRNGFFSMMENVVEAERVEGVTPFVVRPDASTARACKL